MSAFTINGRFLSQNLTGVQRYALGIVQELDTMVEPGEVAIVAPEGTRNPYLKNIDFECYGSLKGNLWEQVDFPRFLRKTRSRQISLCNTVPLLISGGIVAIHDISYKVNPQFFRGPRNAVGRYWRRLNYWRAIYASDCLVTVSEFSKGEILKHYRVPEEKITVAGNAWQHMDCIEADESVFSKFEIPHQGFYFAMSSLASNKNIPWIFESARLTPNKLFVVSGASAPSLKTSELADYPDNVKLVGYLSDGEAKALMESCEAFVFPTFYEGFGIPPLEAIACGAEIIVSDTECMHEVYGEAANYIDPLRPIDLETIALEGSKHRDAVLGRYSWEGSAEKYKRLLDPA